VTRQPKARQGAPWRSGRTERGHVLLVYYFFPPATGGGIPRPAKMAKYLRRLGWEVTVLTVAAHGAVDALLKVEPDVRVIRAAEWPVDPLLRIAGGAVRLARRAWEWITPMDGPGTASLLDLGYVDEEREIEASKIGWTVPGVAAALALDRQRPVDIAVVSSPPASSGGIGVLLRALRGIPYVVEYRDPWTVGPFWALAADGKPRNDPVTRLRFTVARRLESMLLGWASGVVIVNGEDHVGRLRTEFPAQTALKPVAHIPNGVDLEDAVGFAAVTSQGTPGQVRLLHNGYFYHFHTPHHLVAALRAIRRERVETLRGVEFEFVGDGFPERLARQAERWGLGPNIRLTPTMSFSQSLRAMHAADGLIVVLPPLSSDDDRIPTKLYEYLSTRRPIFAAVSPEGATARLLRTVPDAVVADNRDIRAMADALVSFVAMVRHRQVTGAPPEVAQRAAAHGYAARASQMDTFLRGILSEAARKTSRR
jgi:glycosyltransferase involved in cell wall biosynthesis